MKAPERMEGRGKARLCGRVPVFATRRRPAALSSLAAVLALVSIPGFPHGQATDQTAMPRVGPPERPMAGGRRGPLRQLLADCSRTPVCARLPPGWTQFLDGESGCYYYWNAFTQSSQWDSPMCGPQRPTHAPAVPAQGYPPQGHTPAPTSSSPIATATPAPAPLPDVVPSASNSTQNDTLLRLQRVPLRPFVHGAVRLTGVDFHEFRADQDRQRSVASAFLLALRGAGVDSSLSNATLHMLGWCAELRVTCERAPPNTSFGASSSSAGRTDGAAEDALSPGRDVSEGDKADVTEIFLRLDLHGLFFELVHATAADRPPEPPAPDLENSSSSAMGGGRWEEGAGEQGRERGRGWGHADWWPSAAPPAPPQVLEGSGVGAREQCPAACAQTISWYLHGASLFRSERAVLGTTHSECMVSGRQGDASKVPQVPQVRWSTGPRACSGRRWSSACWKQ